MPSALRLVGMPEWTCSTHSIPVQPDDMVFIPPDRLFVLRDHLTLWQGSVLQGSGAMYP
jgi:hypothetical protein